MTPSTVGLDLAKNVFQVHVAGAFGTIIDNELVGQAEPQRQVVEETCYPSTRDRHVHDLARTEPVVVANNVQAPKITDHPAFMQA